MLMHGFFFLLLFIFSLFALLPEQFHYFYSQNLCMYSFKNTCALGLTFYLLAFEYNFLHLFGLV